VWEADFVAVDGSSDINPGAAAWDQDAELLPPDPELPPLHQRDYRVRAWALDESTLLVRGAVMDIRPAPVVTDLVRGFGVSDRRQHPLPIHHMIVDLHVGFPDLVIKEARVVFEVHPQPGCPSIGSHYQRLLGLSISRGFTHKVRELFGGPRGCTHTTALLQAMAPVALQSVFSMRGRSRDQQGPAPAPTFMRDTCHVWAGDGDLWQGVTIGRHPPVPLPTQELLRANGVPTEVIEGRRFGGDP
jgi:Protein of unknown function (DUF2889)